ncbi:MAG: flagellar basal body-associated protein FliL [Paracoccaceae bacterium]
MGKLLPIILLLIGTGAGVGAGVFLRPPPPEPVAEGEVGETEAVIEAPVEEDPQVEREYVKMSNQFVIPLVEQGEVSALVVMSLSIEVEPGFRDVVFAREPKLRDSFLEVMFDHANIGGFQGSFTDVDRLTGLRRAFKDVAIKYGSDKITDVLIMEIAKQSM